ncbi:SpoIIE family protein phosphatase [Streptomyces sp. NPDC003247]|uniref:SpoIIE family protein phosphatase n=1 Tax=Streptomyces sp. NPDC003247 TaxID=3364677 RepID=UPI0036C99C07
MPHDGRARTGLWEPSAPEAGATTGAGAPALLAGPTGAPPQVPGSTASERVLSFAGAALAAVYVPAADGEDLRLAETSSGTDQAHGLAETSSGTDHAHGLPERLPLSGGSPAAHAVRTDRPLWLNDLERAAYDDEGGPPPPGRSLAALPLRTADGRRGCLVVAGTDAQGFDAERRHLLERCAEAVSGLLRAAAGRPAPSSLLAPALRNLGIGSFVLVPGTGLVEADETLLELTGITPDDFDGKAETLLSHALPDDMHALMAVLEPSAQAFGHRRELEFRVRCPTGELRWLSLACRVPAGTGDRPDRILGVVTATPVLRRGPDDVSRIQWLTAALDEATTVRDVGRVAVTALREPLGAGRVALAEAQDGRLDVTVHDPPEPADWPGSWRAAPRPEQQPLVEVPDAALSALRAALRDGRMDLWPAGAAPGPALVDLGPGGLAVLPLPAKGRILGVCLVGWDHAHAFAPEERSFLTAAAALVGQALTRAHAHDAEEELATMLQRSLLPRRLPELPGGTAVARYLPARRGLQVGGDWYDVIALTEDRVALVIGDVQGHSAAAATIMGQMRTAVRAYAVEGHPPDVVLSHANRLLVGMETDLFATCCYAEVDMEEGTLLFVRAGHLAPLVRHPDGTTEEAEVEGGPPLGILADAEFPMTSVTLTPGTVLALITDGLVESADLPLDEGMDRTRAALAAADAADPGAMADALLGDGGRREDDVALLLLRYDGMETRPVKAGWAVWRLPDAVMHARRFTARTLRRWRVEEAADAVLLVVSELVTNALVHTQGPVRIDLVLRGDRVRVSVSDSSPRAPAKPVIVDWESTGGRGLLLVEAVSESSGSVPVAGGKQVWSEIVVTCRDPATGDPPPPTEPGSLW